MVVFMKLRNSLTIFDSFIISIYIDQMTFRSLEMTHFQMIVPRDSAYQTVNMLGQENVMHLIDSGNAL